MLLMVNSPWHRPTSVPVGRARTVARLLMASLPSISAIGKCLTNLGNSLNLVRLLVPIRLSNLLLPTLVLR